MAEVWDETADFVIVGSGGGSMCAALVVKDCGRTPLILEKQSKVGGSTGFSGGVWWIPNNPLMAREGVPDSYERARQYLDAAVTYHGPGTSPDRREAFVKSGPDMVCYLEQKGMRFKRDDGYADYHDDLPGGEPRGRSLLAEDFDINQLGAWKQRLAMFPGMPIRVGLDDLNALFLLRRTWGGKLMALRVGLRLALAKLTGKDLRAAGGSMQGRMLQIALREGIDIRPETAVTDFIVEGGRVVGVVACHKGKTQRIRARTGVLINAGGFARNDAMRQQYGPYPTKGSWTSVNPGDTGEVIQAAIAQGAAVDAMDEYWWILSSRGPNESLPEGATTPDGLSMPFGHHFDISFPHLILVDADGKRFGNESGSYMRLGQALYRRHRETGKGIPAWAIMDRRHRQRYPWGWQLPGMMPKSWLDSGYMKKADTLEELARLCGIDAAGLAQTVDRFNGFCRTGIDEDFHRGGKAFDRYHGDPTVKPNPSLGAIEQGPFYAVTIYPGDVGNAGGLVTDKDGRVLREDGSVIEGLYATGNSTASVMGNAYPGAGASIGASFVFGYRAARHAMRDRNELSPSIGR